MKNKFIGKIYEALPEGKIKAKLEQKLLQQIRNNMKGWSYYKINERNKAKQHLNKSINQVFDEAPQDTILGLKLMANYFNPNSKGKGKDKSKEDRCGGRPP